MSQGVITPVALVPVTKNVVTSFAMKEDAASSGYSGSSPASFGRYAHSHNFFLAFFYYHSSSISEFKDAPSIARSFMAIV